MSLQSNPWVRLRIYPAWRGLESALSDLASLLSQTDPDRAGEIADQVEILLSDPEAAAGRRPAYARVRREGRPPKAGHDEEFEPDLTELAFDLVDTAVFLESPHAVRHLGQRLVSGLPRQWQARISSWTSYLRQVMQSRLSRRSAPEPLAPEAAPLEDELPEGWTPDFAAAGDGQLALVLPQEATPAEIQAAHAELLYLVLMQWGLDVARIHLHLLITGPDSPVSHESVGQVLGLRRRSGERPGRAVEQLQNIRLTVYRWYLDGEALEYERSSGPLWDLQVTYFGQARLLEQGGKLTTRGEEWSVRVRPGVLVPPPSPGALCPRLEHFNPLAACSAILLAFAGRSGATEVLLPHDLLTRASSLDPQDTGPRHLKAAARAQAGWGWRAELGENFTRFMVEEDLPD